jgi:hypothetical protein
MSILSAYSRRPTLALTTTYASAPHIVLVMPRSFCIPGVVFLFCAVVLLFIVSVSLPYLTAMDIARVRFNNNKVSIKPTTDILIQLRVSSSINFLNATCHSLML